MPIRASAAGAKLEARTFDVTEREILAYAAGIGETGERAFDDAREAGIVALPPYCVSLEWPVVRAPGGENPYGATFDEVLRGVHASQDSTFHRPIRPGDRLRTEGLIAQVRPTRAGALVASKLQTVDAASGEPVVTSWYGSIFRGVAIEGEPVTVEEPPAADPDETEPDRTDSIEVAIAREAPHVYTECARIWNPIHTERRVALAAGLPDIILHGTATWALAAREILRTRAGGDPTRLRRLAGRFRAVVIPGTTVCIEIGAAHSGRVRYTVRNALGELAIAGGVAELG